MPCGIKDISLESAKNNKFVLRKLDRPVRKNPRPPKLTITAQKILLKRRDPLN